MSYFYYIQNHSRKHVKLIVPAGFRGQIVLRESATGSPFSKALLPDGEEAAVYIVPSDGILNTLDLGPLESWHILSAEFSDGVFLPTYLQIASSGSRLKSVHLRSTVSVVRGSGEREIHYFVGTLDEFEQWKNK
ncbi:hypothetical protein [Blastopirellula retiformator]|uniref:hypothetical protein n=1 Tax=Blastopirellula retiformator TaxID=2527970 RepID=UPI001C95BBF0|nr:hypothetical protein [Blastopirellula retiformator]